VVDYSEVSLSSMRILVSISSQPFDHKLQALALLDLRYPSVVLEVLLVANSVLGDTIVLLHITHDVSAVVGYECVSQIHRTIPAPIVLFRVRLQLTE